MDRYTFILRACSEEIRPAVALLLSRAFSLKDATCTSIAASAPIILLTDLTQEECVVMKVVLSGFRRAGATTEFLTTIPDDLPKIDWPRRPQVFKRDIMEHVLDFQAQVPMPNGIQESLINLLLINLRPGSGVSRPGTVRVNNSGAHQINKPSEFRGIQLPEITPFGGQAVLSSGPAMTPPGGVVSDPTARLNELFPDDDSMGFVPNNQDINNILNKLLPDEDTSGSGPIGSSSSGRRAAVAPTGHAVFLAKIADESRRQKAVPLIAELAGITTEEADARSKKVIIPVLKGASKEDAESAKQKFAKIGILARVKGPE